MLTPPPRKRRKEARPAELMAAALALFVEKGFSATRLDDVAARAGVSKGTLYLYFDNKDALLKALIQEGILPVVAENEQIAARHSGSSFDLLEKLLDNWWGKIGLTGFAGIPKLMVAEARDFPEVAQFYYENVIRRGRALVGAALERGMASGEFRRMKVETTIDAVSYTHLDVYKRQVVVDVVRHAAKLMQPGLNADILEPELPLLYATA